MSEPENESDVFRRNLLHFMKLRGFSAASLSRKAGLNSRAVKDIEERRTGSPRISTVFKLARALDMAPEILLGLTVPQADHPGQQPAHDPEIDAFLSSLSQSERESLAASIRHLIQLGQR
ncbi:helix-turn-helix domain-containing protein [Roseinatronobacter alkalisoli]|uniref:Helix-turn-helix transcriptional regulator n=1 Tax=Roseinatronobacter alkalisoli TaxID=3028235 RepID=A0ABT5TBJ2_9RHOB|nr:helix-turn-helix transcriptional regulator [Roseinatronobacter sp. HJB301]MDD7972459.1 helix-turn-helix transcriptional regulator [Roseinatronobacter sp. HJB301]